MAINDYRNSGKEPNCKFVEFLYLGFPAVAKIVTRPVAAGEELLTDYGKQFWDRQEVVESTYPPEYMHRLEQKVLPLIEQLRRAIP